MNKSNMLLLAGMGTAGHQVSALKACSIIYAYCSAWLRLKFNTKIGLHIPPPTPPNYKFF